MKNGQTDRFNSSPALILLIAVTYAAMAKVSFLFTIPPGNITPIFPAAGLALATAIVLGSRAWLGIWIGSFAANALSFIDGSMPSAKNGYINLLIAAFIALGAMSGAATGAFLMKRFCRDEHTMMSGRNILILITVSCFGCCLISPTFGVFGLSLNGNVPWERFGYSWFTWWIGDAAGALVIAPLLLAWLSPHHFEKKSNRISEAVVLSSLTLLICYFVFFRNMPYEYSLLPLLLWAALRFGMRGVTISIAIVVLLAIIGTSRGSSPFTGNTSNESLLLLNSFFGVTITCALFLAGMIEERRRADEKTQALNRELRRSEERLRMLGDNLPESYVYQCTQDEDGTPQFLYISAGVEKLHGISIQAALDDASLLRGKIDPDMLPSLKAAEEISLRDLADFSMEVRMQNADGQWRWMQLCSRPRHISDGRIMWDGVATDITKLKQAEAANQAAEQKLADIIEFLPDATFVINQDKRIVAWNRACELLTGVEKDALLGRGDYAYSEPFFGERRPILIDLLDLSMPEMETNYKYVRRHGDRIYGESFIARLNKGCGAHLWGVAAPLFDQEGRRCGAIEVIRDVTEQKLIEKAMLESERKYRELVEHANSIILRWRSDGIITFLNEFGLRFFGYSAEELLGRHVMGTIVPPTESDGLDLLHLIEQISADPKAFEQNINENMRRNGDRVWISWTNKVVLDPQGNAAEILSVGTDITERKWAYEQIQKLHKDLQHYAAELEQRVEERTAELAVARDKAQEADRLKSAFLATMSHELRTPLNSIIGFTGIILQGLAGPLNSEQRKQLEMVRGSAQHLLELINDVLDISKIEAGQMQVHCAPFNLRASIEKAVNSISPLAKNKGLDLQTQLAPEIGLWTSDQRRIEQILINLLNNAIKFTDRGRITLAAGIIEEILHISIIDTGIGIKPEDLQNLFRPFSQVDTGLTRNYDGTGLGLAICRRLTELLGGEIHAESEWGKGSTFTVLLKAGNGAAL